VPDANSQDSSHRLSILSQHEIDELYGLPCFSDDDRLMYFDLSDPEQHVVDAHTAPVAIHLILQMDVSGLFGVTRL
jgi:hypothetical protein